MKISKYKAIIFDFDGVLVDSVNIKTKAFAKLYEPYGQYVVESVVAFHQENGGVSRYEKFKYFHKNFLGIMISDDDMAVLSDEFSSIVQSEVIQAPWIKGAFEFLKEFYITINFYIASATPHDELLQIACMRQMMHFFKGIYGAPVTKSAIINDIINKEINDKDQVVMIGDAKADYNAAADNGIDFIGITDIPNYFPRAKKIMKNLSFLKDYLLEDLKQLG